MKFYYGSGSPFAWRVWLALEEKGLRYDHVLLSFQAGDLKKPEYLAISPHGKVPALVDDDGTALYESQAILEYLEERYPERPLLPGDPAGRARVRIEEIEAVNYFSEAFSKVARQLFFTPVAERDEKALADGREELRGLLALLDARAAKRGKDFLAARLCRTPTVRGFRTSSCLHARASISIRARHRGSRRGATACVRAPATSTRTRRTGGNR
jgi:glutathione S-transferase